MRQATILETCVTDDTTIGLWYNKTMVMCVIRNCNGKPDEGTFMCGRHTRKKRRSFKRENPHLYDKDEIQQLRFTLIEKYGEVCMCCGSTTDIILEHIKSRYIGGTNDIDNLQLLCWKCNFEKGHKQIDYRL